MNNNLVVVEAKVVVVVVQVVFSLVQNLYSFCFLLVRRSSAVSSAESSACLYSLPPKGFSWPPLISAPLIRSLVVVAVVVVEVVQRNLLLPSLTLELLFF